jgi:predicted NBD/HSP70 family sugar kinase
MTQANNKFPAHTQLAKRLERNPIAMATTVEGCKALSAEFNQLRALADEMAAALRQALDAASNTLACGVIYIGLDDTPDIISSALNKYNETVGK